MGEKAGGDYLPHMDATPKESFVPPTPDILSSLSRRGISDLSVVAVSPHHTLYRHQHRRISSRRYLSLLVFGGDCCTSRKPSRTSPSSSPTCLDHLHFLHPVVEELSISRRIFDVLETGRCAPESSIAAGSETILSVDSPTWHLNTTTSIIHQAEGEFFTHRVFTPRQRAFDAYFITSDQRRAGRSLHLTVIIFCVDEYIDRSVHKRLTQKYSLKLNHANNVTQRCHAAYARNREANSRQ